MTNRQPARTACGPTVLAVTQRARRAGFRRHLVLVAAAALTSLLLPSSVASETLDLRDQDPRGRTSLHHAAAAGDVDAIADLLAAGASVETRDERGFTPLLAAVATGTPASVRALLDAQPEPERDAPPLRHWYGRSLTPLVLAARRGDLSIVREVATTGVTKRELREAASVAIFVEDEQTALWLLRAQPARQPSDPPVQSLLPGAVRADLHAVVDVLLERANVAQAQHALSLAAGAGQAAMVDRLLDAGVSPDPPSGGEGSALHAALGAGHVGIARRLLEAGASTTATTYGGHAVIHAAAASGDAEIVRELLDDGAPVNARSDAGHTPLDIAERHGCEDVASLLRERGGTRGKAGPHPAASLPDHLRWRCGGQLPPAPEGHLPHCIQAAALGDLERLEACLAAATERDVHQLMEMACHHGDTVSAAVLLRHLADVNDPISLGATALNLAAREGHVELVRLFLDAGADPNIADIEGRTALHVAAGSGDVNLIDLLLAAGADARRETDSCASTLHFAAISGPAEAVQRLWAEGADAQQYCTERSSTLRVGSMEFKSSNDIALLACVWETPLMGSDAVTPMHLAALSDEADVIRELLALGYDPDEANWRGVTPLHLAVRHDSFAAAEILLNAGCDPNAAATFSSSYPGRPSVEDRRPDEREHVLVAPLDAAQSADMRLLLNEYEAMRASERN